VSQTILEVSSYYYYHFYYYYYYYNYYYGSAVSKHDCGDTNFTGID